jgi:hypothetical protein
MSGQISIGVIRETYSDNSVRTSSAQEQAKKRDKRLHDERPLVEIDATGTDQSWGLHRVLYFSTEH